MIRTGVARAVKLAVLVAALGAWSASAQCIVEYDAELRFPLQSGSQVTDDPVVITGTFDCGVVSGMLCGSGTVSGDCTLNTNTAYVVSCDGSCTADFGGTPADVTCDGAALFRGQVSGQCAGGACQSQSSGEDGTTGFSVAVADIATLQNGIQNCALEGVTGGHYVGVTTIPLPLP